MTWEEKGVKACAGELCRRFVYAPYRELDFIELPAPILAVGAGPFGVTFQCADGGLYWLTGEPLYPIETWNIRLVAK